MTVLVLIFLSFFTFILVFSIANEPVLKLFFRVRFIYLLYCLLINYTFLSCDGFFEISFFHLTVFIVSYLLYLTFYLKYFSTLFHKYVKLFSKVPTFCVSVFKYYLTLQSYFLILSKLQHFFNKIILKEILMNFLIIFISNRIFMLGGSINEFANSHLLNLHRKRFDLYKFKTIQKFI